jgi:3-hydroxyisobutyrate dehydrogenase-like beta-hydroxyacid dehydrogenase
VLAELSGLDLGTTLDVLRRSAAGSRALEAWGEQMVAGRHDQPVSTIRTGSKDGALIARRASAGGAAPAWAVFTGLLEEAIDGGLADHDNSAIIEVLRRRAGIGRVVPPRSGESQRPGHH